MTDTDTTVRGRLAKAAADIEECDRQLAEAKAAAQAARGELGRVTAAGIREGVSDSPEIKRSRKARADADSEVERLELARKHLQAEHDAAFDDIADEDEAAARAELAATQDATRAACARWDAAVLELEAAGYAVHDQMKAIESLGRGPNRKSRFELLGGVATTLQQCWRSLPTEMLFHIGIGRDIANEGGKQRPRPLAELLRKRYLSPDLWPRGKRDVPRRSQASAPDVDRAA
jgi:hypothetical protein